MSTVAGQPVQFRIRPQRRSFLSCQVEVWPDAKSFRNRIRVLSQWDHVRVRGLMAATFGCRLHRRRPGRAERLTGVFAVLVFSQKDLGMATLTHEAFHATMRWAERKGWTAIPLHLGHGNIDRKRVNSIEEQCAKAHDNICRRLVIELRRHKVI